jgi:porphobilinogen synthase
MLDIKYEEIIGGKFRRLRKNQEIRDLVKETSIDISSLVYPLFIKEGISGREEIKSMKGIYRLSIEESLEEIEKARKLGIKSFLLFGIPLKKDEKGSEAYSKNGIIQKALRRIRESIGKNVLLITDVCLCQYTSHGHCGIVKNGYVVNEETLELLSAIAVTHAEAGADIVAPSAMMDNQVLAIRRALDKAGYSDISIMSYSAKFASVFYAPFREAAYSAPAFGDRKTYQMDFRNPREALREIERDIEEGADIVMVKPALAYLDIISLAKRNFNYPIAAYNVSGEYAMIKLGAEVGLWDEKQAVNEVITAIKRAGADIIISYHALEYAKWKINGEI